MTPRLPPENPDDDVQSELLQAVHTALNDLAPINDPVEEHQLFMERDRIRSRICKAGNLEECTDKSGPTSTGRD